VAESSRNPPESKRHGSGAMSSHNLSCHPRPVKTFKQGDVEVSVWRNPGENGDMYNITIRNSYKDDRSGDWKETKSFSPTDPCRRVTAFHPSIPTHH
jgi:hypothetical protein